MSQDVWYSERWNNLKQDLVPGFPQYDEATARVRWHNGDGGLAIDAARIRGDGRPAPEWMIGYGPEGFRVSFFDEHGTEWQEIDYDIVDGRLFRCQMTEYTYPDEEQFWRVDEAVVSISAFVRPDGTGSIEIHDERAGIEHFTEFTDIDLTTFWLDVPEFGEWDALLDTAHGASEVAESVSEPASGS